MKTVLRSVIVGLVVITALTACSMTPVRQHPDFASGKQKVRVVAILPADVEFRHLVFTGENERDTALEQSIATELNSGAGAMLQSRGYLIKEDLLKRAEAGDKQFNFEYEQFKSAYSQVYKELYAQPMMQEEQANKFKLGIGPLANPIAQSCNADALLLVRYAGFDKSHGLLAKEIVGSALLAVLTGVVASPAPKGGHIDLALIDGVSGDILWTNSYAGPVPHGASLNMAMSKLPGLKETASEPAVVAKTDAPAANPSVTAAEPAAKGQALVAPASKP